MVGVTAALIGSAVIGAGASIIGGSKNSKAIGRASDAQAQSNREAIAAQEKARSENLALQKPIYDAGMPAINARNALLGLGGAPAPARSGNALAPANDRMPAGYGYGLSEDYAMSPRQSGRASLFGNRTGLPSPGVQRPPTATGGYGGGTPMGGQTAQQAAENAFDIFRNSTGYQFRLNEGYDALNSGWAARGTLQSGAAGKSFEDYGQNFASAEFGNYMGLLGEQQSLTAGAANAMSGVNTNYANNASNLAIANGQNQANAAIARANNSNAMLQGVGGAFGNALGAYAYRAGN